MAVFIDIFLTNTTLVPVSWGGLEIDVNETVSVEEISCLRLLSDPDFLTALMAAEAIISDSEYPLPPRIAVGLLQYNPVILNEYYTLTDEDSTLIGNGQILTLNDDSWDMDVSNNSEPEDDF